MLDGKRLVCVLPAYNAEKTLLPTLEAVPPNIVDLFILTDLILVLNGVMSAFARLALLIFLLERVG